MEYESARGTVEVEYYLVEWTRDFPSNEQRERRWCTVDKALTLLGFDGAKELLTIAARKWDDERASRVP